MARNPNPHVDARNARSTMRGTWWAVGAALVALLLLSIGLSSLASAASVQSKPDKPGGGKPSASPSESATPTSSASPSESPSASASGSPSEEEVTPSGSPSSSATETEGEPEPALVCIATGDPLSPYSVASFAASSIINGKGQVKNEGPANSPTGVYPNEVWGNIVPPVTHPNGVATFAGLNWGADGQEIWNDGCGYGGVDPTGSPSPTPTEEHEKVTVCIATGLAEGPYESDEFSATDIISGEGVVKSTGPANSIEGLFPADAEWGNIVPPVTHPNGRATFDGLNWTTAGQQILADGCAYIAPTATPTPTSTSTAASTPAPVGTLAAVPAATGTPTPSPSPAEATPAPVGITVPLPGIQALEDPDVTVLAVPLAGTAGAPAAGMEFPSGVPAGGGALAADSQQLRLSNVWQSALLIAVGALGLLVSAVRLERIARR